MTPTSGRMATAQRAKECPDNVIVHFLFIQTLAVQSQDPEIRVPKVPTKMLVTFSACPSIWKSGSSTSGRKALILPS